MEMSDLDMLTMNISEIKDIEIRRRYSQIPRETIAYFAGIVDGEGTISLKVRGRGDVSFHPWLYVGNTNEKLIIFLHNTFGGNVWKSKGFNERSKDCFHWQATTLEGYVLCEMIESFLLLKRRQARIIVEYKDTLLIGGHRKVDDEILAKRKALKEEINFLNKKGR